MAGASNLVPLIILFVVVGGGGYIGYQIYLWSNEVTDRGKKSLEKKNMSFTKEGGLKVGVKERSAEEYTDKTQNVLVNVWNNSGNHMTSSGHSTPRASTSRTSSSATASGNSANLSAPRSSTHSSASPIPGSF